MNTVICPPISSHKWNFTLIYNNFTCITSNEAELTNVSNNEEWLNAKLIFISLILFTYALHLLLFIFTIIRNFLFHYLLFIYYCLLFIVLLFIYYLFTVVCYLLLYYLFIFIIVLLLVYHLLYNIIYHYYLFTEIYHNRLDQLRCLFNSYFPYFNLY